MARQLRKEVAEERKGLDLSMEFLSPLADMLDDKKALHIQTLYFTLDGNYHLNVYECENKVYSRLEWVPVKIGDKQTFRKEGLKENLIVEAIDAQKIVDDVLAWRKDGCPLTKVDLKSISKPVIEKKLSVEEKIKQQKKTINK